jgi:hypothetical protein
MDILPIDIVYFWVNTTDEGWIERRTQAMLKSGTKWGEEMLHKRYEDHKELIFALRSLEKNAPWIRKVFLVVNKKGPDWIVDTHPKLRIIDQADLMPGSPESFNTEILQMSSGNISELSDHFLLSGDDELFTKTVYPSDFFDNTGRSIATVRTMRKCRRLNGYPCENSLTKGIYALGEVLSMKEGCKRAKSRKVPMFFGHNRVPIDKRILREMMSEIKWEYMKNNQIRTCGDLNFAQLWLSYAWARGRMIFGPQISVTIEDRQMLIEAIKDLPKLTCLNVFPEGAEEFLVNHFPDKSSFER